MVSRVPFQTKSGPKWWVGLSKLATRQWERPQIWEWPVGQPGEADLLDDPLEFGSWLAPWSQQTTINSLQAKIWNSCIPCFAGKYQPRSTWKRPCRDPLKQPSDHSPGAQREASALTLKRMARAKRVGHRPVDESTNCPQRFKAQAAFEFKQGSRSRKRRRCRN